MGTGSAERALERIEAALARIDQAALPAASDDGLAERHRRLREATGQALRRLDALLAAQPSQD
ncbi:MAG: hypothetical protein ABIT04_02295 [Novosphingobium sp.]